MWLLLPLLATAVAAVRCGPGDTVLSHLASEECRPYDESCWRLGVVLDEGPSLKGAPRMLRIAWQDAESCQEQDQHRWLAIKAGEICHDDAAIDAELAIYGPGSRHDIYRSIALADQGRRQFFLGASSHAALWWGPEAVAVPLTELRQTTARRVVVANVFEADGDLLSYRGDAGCRLAAAAAASGFHVTVAEPLVPFAVVCEESLRSAGVLLQPGEVDSGTLSRATCERKPWDELIKRLQIGGSDLAVVLLASEHLPQAWVPGVRLSRTGALRSRSAAAWAVRAAVSLSGLSPSQYPTFVLPAAVTMVCALLASQRLWGLSKATGFDLSEFHAAPEVMSQLPVQLLDPGHVLLTGPHAMVYFTFDRTVWRDGQIVQMLQRDGVKVLVEGTATHFVCWMERGLAEDLSKITPLSNHPSKSGLPGSAQYVYRLPAATHLQKRHSLKIKARLENTQSGPEFSIEHTLDGSNEHELILDTNLPCKPDCVWKRSMQWAMLQDSQRNNAFDRALQRTVAKLRQGNAEGPQLLDLGSGSGLLTMQGLRAGCASADAFELRTDLVVASRKVLNANGFGRRARVWHINSTTIVDPINQLGWINKADILVTETFALGDGLGEGVLESLRHAWRTLLADGAAVIPARMEIYGQFVAPPEGFNRTEHDVTAWERLLARREPGGTWFGYALNLFQTKALRELSEPMLLRAYDLDDARAPWLHHRPASASETTHHAKVRRSGPILGCKVWFELLMDRYGPPEIRISNRLAGTETEDAWRSLHWQPLLMPIAGRPPAALLANPGHTGTTVTIVAAERGSVLSPDGLKLRWATAT